MNWKAKIKIFFKRLCCCNNNDYHEIQDKPPIRYDIYGDVFDINKFVIKHKGQ